MKTPKSVFALVACFTAAGWTASPAAIVASYNFDGASSAERRASKDTDVDSAASILSPGAGLGTEGNSTTSWLVSTTAGIGTPSRGNTLFASNSAISGSAATPATEADAVTGNDYFEFTFTPNAATTWNLTSVELEFYWARTSVATANPTPTPEVSVFIRSSLDSFGTTLGSATNTGLWGANGEATADADFGPLSIDLESLAAYDAVSAPVTFRIYMMDNLEYTGNSGWGIRIDNIELEGTLVPEPSAGISLAAAGVLVLLRRSRSRRD